jgi:O-succinylbenzoic acid--CoA ligase
MVNVSFIDKNESLSISETLNSSLLSQYDEASLSFLKQWFSNASTIEVQTSGSTGTPKKILLSKERMEASARLTLEYFGLKEGDTILQCLPSKFIAGKMIWVRAIVGELEVVVVQPSANPVKKLQQTIKFSAMTPHQVETVLNESKEKLDFIEILIIGGAPVSNALLERLQSLKTKCFATYGMTETITHIAVKQLNHTGKSDEYEALPTVTFSLGEDDNLKINAPHISKEWLETEDIVRLTDETHFEWLGRKDFVINSGGVKLFPEVIEQKISQLIPNRFFVAKKEDETFGEVPLLVLEGVKTFDLNVLTNLVTKIEMPKAVIYLSEFKETKSGKIDRVGSLNTL